MQTIYPEPVEVIASMPECVEASYETMGDDGIFYEGDSRPVFPRFKGRLRPTRGLRLRRTGKGEFYLLNTGEGNLLVMDQTDRVRASDECSNFPLLPGQFSKMSGQSSVFVEIHPEQS